MKSFLKDNISVWIWSALVVFVELFSVSFTNCKPFLTTPAYALALWFFFFLILLLIPNRIAKIVLTSVLLAGQMAICVGFIYLYESNGTCFDFSMLNMRNDAFGTIEDLSLDWVHLAVCLSVLVAFVVSMVLVEVLYFRKHKEEHFKAGKKYNIPVSVVMTLMLACIAVVPVWQGYINRQDSYQEMLYNQNASKYQTKGITANAVYEIFRGAFDVSRVNTKDVSLVDGALSQENPKLYTETSQFKGISEGNNLIMLMVESFDWYPLTLYYDAETVNEIYPNITKFMSESIVLNNYYTREKTDTSENNALLGSNPTGKYVNYDFADNAYPYSLVNMFKNKYPNVVANAFHQNDGTFYNRKELFESYGFDKFYDIEEMKAFGVTNEWNEDSFKGERTKDSETMEHMVETMFPTDEQFLTYWLTFSMHGYYVERKNFANFVYTDQYGMQYDGGYYGYFDAKGVFPEGISKKADYVRTYACALKDFDVALGIMMDYLEENELLDHTTIFMYADHNTYYNNLAKFAKDIDELYNSELYHIPAMIYDQKLATAYKEAKGDEAMQVVYGTDNNEAYKCLTLSKFTTTIDFIPTVFDIFNIKGYHDLYPGTSVLIDDVESIIYSRAYGIFVTDKLVCFSANHLLYSCEGFTEEDRQDFIARAEEHLRIKEITDKVFYSDYFSTHDYVFPPNDNGIA